ncbi:MAG TPA: tryptophan synthase subunit alpha, partial [bacterium]|nr:tryptophan synthase subunit alpha [bacterium]
MSQALRLLFQEARRAGRALFLPYVCVGYPSYAASLKTAEAALKAGAAGLELGVPFSDPIADGPTLQMATQCALDHGAHVAQVFRLIRDLRRRGFGQPLLVMTYLNPVEQMGWGTFARRIARAGGDGAIVPDLPLERFADGGAALGAFGLSLIPFLAPTSSPDRVRKVEALQAPFLYYVSLTGVTGARRSLAPGLLAALRELRKKLRTPVVVGFGISNARQAAQVG